MSLTMPTRKKAEMETRTVFRRWRWLLALMVGALVSAGCGGPADVGLHSDDRLMQLTTQLVSEPTGDDLAVLRLVLAEQADSVRDMTSMTVADFTAAHRRGPSDQAALIGAWYGRADRVLSGPAVSAQLDRAAQDTAINLTGDKRVSTSKMVGGLASYFNEHMPNDETVNPYYFDAYLLRSTFQNGYTAENRR